jgi:glucose-1-phosphate thymidylyltransferase
LYPLTANFPKPLLRIGSSTILGMILKKVRNVPEIDGVFLVTNDKFERFFVDYLRANPCGMNIRCINDGSRSNETRLGAIADLRLAITGCGIEEDCMVLAGDNIFDFPLEGFSRYFFNKGTDCITVHELDDLDALQRTGVAELSPESRVLGFEEKPRNPKSRYAVPPFYLYRKETLPLIGEYIEAGNNPDAPGNFIPWLIRRKTVFAYSFVGMRYDIGTLESYEAACRLFT